MVDGTDVVVKLHKEANIAEGKRVVFASRPEAVEITTDGVLKGTVKESYLSGKDVLVDVVVGEQSMRAYIDANLEVKENDSIAMSFKDKGVFVFDEETGERYV